MPLDFLCNTSFSFFTLPWGSSLLTISFFPFLIIKKKKIAYLEYNYDNNDLANLSDFVLKLLRKRNS